MASTSTTDPCAVAIGTILDKIKSLQIELKDAEEALSNQAANEPENQEDDNESPTTRKIREEYEAMIHEIAVLKKSVPEGFQSYICAIKKYFNDFSFQDSQKKRSFNTFWPSPNFNKALPISESWRPSQNQLLPKSKSNFKVNSHHDRL